MNRSYLLARILLIEDSLADIELVKYVFEDVRLCNNLQIISNGSEAFDFLSQPATSGSDVLPDIIFLDLNLPGLQGREILERLSPEQRRDMVVIVLTGCEAERELVIEQGINADYFLVKPLDIAKVVAVVKKLKDHYLGILVSGKQTHESVT